MRYDPDNLKITVNGVYFEGVSSYVESLYVGNYDAGSELDQLLSYKVVSREIYGTDPNVRLNDHCYWDAEFDNWTENDDHYRNRLNSCNEQGEIK